MWCRVSYTHVYTHLNVLSQLNTSGAVRQMQEVIGRNAHQLVYGVDGHYRDDDAVGSLVHGLMAEIRQRTPTATRLRTD